MALFFIPLTSIILSGQPPEKIPAASGLSNFVRITVRCDRCVDLDHDLGEPLGRSTTRNWWRQINPYSATYTEQLRHLMQMGRGAERRPSG